VKTLGYCLKAACRSIWREKWINLLAVLSVGIGLLILSAFSIITVNIDSLLQKWARSFGIVIYLQDSISSEQKSALEAKRQRDPVVKAVRFISQEDALKEMRPSLGDKAVILDAFRENPLPASFEIKLDEEGLSPEAVRNKAAELRKLPGVEDVQYGEKWLASLYSVSRGMKIGAVIVGLIIFVAITFMTYSTIKIFFYRKKDEIETLKLLGATRNFTRLPFLIEGIFIGALGGILSALAVLAVHTLGASQLAGYFPSVKLFLSSFPALLYALIPVAGAIMSLAGSFIAVGKIRY